MKLIRRYGPTTCSSLRSWNAALAVSTGLRENVSDYRMEIGLNGRTSFWAGNLNVSRSWSLGLIGEGYRM